MSNSPTLFNLYFNVNKKKIIFLTAGLFLAGSRYGRSETANIKNSKNVPKVVEILPRVDRFFVGSRYGKRADIQSYNMACLKCFVAALNYLDRFQHVQLMQREGGINYDKNKEYNDNQENKREFKHNLVL